MFEGSEKVAKGATTTTPPPNRHELFFYLRRLKVASGSTKPWGFNLIIMPSTNLSIAFLGASTGVGLSTLCHCLQAGHECIALCRDPSKLAAIFPDHPKLLRIIQGNAHNIDDVMECLQVGKKDDKRLVDFVVSTIGGKPVLSKLSIDDPDVCGKGAAALIEAIARLKRAKAKEELDDGPHIIACSTTGISLFGRDVPLPLLPLYRFLLAVPHRDKRVMEDCLVRSRGIAPFTIVRCSLLVDGATTTGDNDDDGDGGRIIRVGVEDPIQGCRVSEAVGYTISREDAGRWIFANVISPSAPSSSSSGDAGMYRNRIVTITY